MSRAGAWRSRRRELVSKVLNVDSAVIDDAEIPQHREVVSQRSRGRSISQRSGRIFLAGDAAHKVPPWGGFGTNASFGDVHNLIWKLALAVKSPKQDWNALLDTYRMAPPRPLQGPGACRCSLASIRTPNGRIDIRLAVDSKATLKALQERLQRSSG
ncbi:hypothetical protein NW754_016743 [Fusarium falciforme]|nr:hypothetical protein NW754_016743 [Fusarium falciforme]